MRAVFAQAGINGGFDGFEGAELALLYGAGVAAVLWLLLAGVLWFASRPRFPDPAPATTDLGAEPPAVANMLVNRWNLTRLAMPATLIDLAARRVLGIEDYAGGRHVVRIRSNQPEGEPLTPYEEQVVELVRTRATGGSAPVEALDLGASKQADAWWKRFSDAVEKDARERGLARGRWTQRDRVLLSAGLAVVLGLFGLAFSLAEVGQTAEDDESDRWVWVGAAGFAWVGATLWFARTGALRETGLGREVCARWLGVRQYLRESAAFGDLPPGAVAVWERYFAYATAFGLAHTAARALPFATDDPGTAWSRYSGQWEQVRVTYPTRFMFGQMPAKVFLYGLGLTAFWGFIGLYLLPVSAQLAWDIGTDLIEDGDLADSNAQLGLAVGIAAVVAGLGAYVLYRLIDGVARLLLGLFDVGKSVTVTGEVANIYQGRVALADGVADEVRAWWPSTGSPPLRRGQVARVTMSPRLCYVTKVEVLDSEQAEPDAIPAAESGAAAQARELPAALGPVDAATISAIAGLPLTSADSAAASAMASAGGFAQTFTDGEDGAVRIQLTPAAAGIGTVFGIVSKLGGGEPVEISGRHARWMRGRLLALPLDGRMLAIEVELAGLDEEAKRALATRLAEHVMSESARTATA